MTDFREECECPQGIRTRDAECSVFAPKQRPARAQIVRLARRRLCVAADLANDAVDDARKLRVCAGVATDQFSSDVDSLSAHARQPSDRRGHSLVTISARAHTHRRPRRARAGDPRETVLTEMGHAAATLEITPASVIVFGSFARGEAGRDSDLDAVFVRPDDTDEDDQRWAACLEQWRTTIRALTGNPVEVLEVPEREAAARLASGQPVWLDIRRDGRVVYGQSLDELAGASIA